MRCLDRHIPNNNTLEEKFGKPGEKSSDCRSNWWQTELKYDAFAGMELKPQGGGGGAVLTTTSYLLYFCCGRVERNPTCSLKSSFLLKSILLRIPNLCSVKIKKAILFCQPWSPTPMTFYIYNIIQFFVLLKGTASKLIHLVHSTEFPYSSFAVLETGTCLVADSGFDSLMSKLKTFYAPRKTSKIEVNILVL